MNISSKIVSFRGTSILLVVIATLIMLMESVAGEALAGGGNSNSSMSTESENTTNQRTHSDLIRSCSTFRDILSEEGAYSCDYSMLYYKGQCELNSSLLMQNRTESDTETLEDLSFCLDSRLDEYIQKYGLTDSPRPASLIPSSGFPIA